MRGMKIAEFETKLRNLPSEKPDEYDLKMLAEIDAEDDGAYTDFDEYVAKRAVREKNGHLSLNIPNDLYQFFVSAAREQGVSLNQYSMSALAFYRGFVESQKSRE